MTDLSDPFDQHGNRKESPRHTRSDYAVRVCLTCGCEIAAPPSRMAWVLRMHVVRCESSTPEDRMVFRRTRRWPKRKRSTKPGSKTASIEREVTGRLFRDVAQVLGKDDDLMPGYEDEGPEAEAWRAARDELVAELERRASGEDPG